MINIQHNLDKFAKTIAKLQLFTEVLPQIAGAFDKCSWYNCYEEGKIIAECKTREDFAPIRALHKGVWGKSVSHNEASYRADIMGIEVWVNVRELPPSCKVVEEKVFIEAHEETKYKVVCNEPEPATL